MLHVRCPICGETLEQNDTSWRCERGHQFDVARQGYVNLLTVAQKHSKNPGDTREQIAARKDFLDAGFYKPIADTLSRIILPYAPEIILDVGCGEGYYLTQLGQALPDTELWGLDIAKDAVRYAAVRNKRAHWLTATAAHLPFPDESFDCLISMFALTSPAEFQRVLKPGGLFVQVIAGTAHLMALKRIIYREIILREKVLHPELDGFMLTNSETAAFSFTLSANTQVQNLLAMTPHYFRISKDGAQRIAGTQTLKDRAEVIFNCYRRI